MARAPKALLPAPPAASGTAKNDPRGRSKMLWNAVDAPNSAYADAIRSVKLSLDSDPDAGCQVIGLTSHMPAEGKSTIAAGVASQLAATGRRVMLIDCDVRNPSLSRALFPDAKLGLLDVAVGEANLAQVLWRDAATNLTFLPMVPKPSLRNPTEALASRNVKLLIESLKNYCDFIIVDSCPVLPVADALLVGQHVDGVVFSIMQDISQLPKVLVASEKLAQLNIPLVGAVVNGIRSQDMYSYGYNYIKQLPA